MAGLVETVQQSLNLDEGGRSETVSMSTTSAQSSVITSGHVVLSVDTACYIRQGSSPTAVSTGADQYILADTMYRVKVKSGNKIAFILGTGTGTAYITPGA